MSDPSKEEPATTGASQIVMLPPPPAEPVEVKDNPAKEQVAAALRQILGGASLVAGALIAAGYLAPKWATIISLALGNVGPIVAIFFGVVALVTTIWGNIRTGKLASDGKKMADLLPNDYAKTK